MARRSSPYSGTVSLGRYLDSPVKPMDVIVGAIVGLGVGAAVKYAVDKVAPDALASVKTALGSGAGAILPIGTGFSAAAILYFAQRNMDESRATGHAIGAAVGGLVLGAFDFLRTSDMTKAYFSDNPVALNLNDYRGLLVDNAARRSLGGLLVDNANLGSLGAASMGGDDDMGYADIVQLTS